MNNFNYEIVEFYVIKDFDSFNFIDKPIEWYCAYNRSKHIQMATHLTLKTFTECEKSFGTVDLEDFIHGLNHIFFNGVVAGQNLEQFRGGN